MALILIALSLVAGLSLGLWLFASVPQSIYTYLSVVFLVVLDGLLYSYQRLQNGEGIWLRLLQRTTLQLAFGAFIIFFGAKAGRDLLLLAVIPIGINVFANFAHLIPREAGEVFVIARPASAVTYSHEGSHATYEPPPLPAIEVFPVGAAAPEGYDPEAATVRARRERAAVHAPRGNGANGSS